MRSKLAILLCMSLALAVSVPAFSAPLPEGPFQRGAGPWQMWLPIAMKQAVMPTPTLTSTLVPGLRVRGDVRLDSATGPGLAGVGIHLFFASYGPGDVVAVTNGDGYYQTSFFYIPGDEMVTVWPELAGYAFDPPQHYWRHYYGLEEAIRDFVAHPVAPTSTATDTATPTCTQTEPPSPTCTATLTQTQTGTPTRTGTPTLAATPGPLIFWDDFDDGLLTGWTGNRGVWTNPGAYMRGEDTEPPAREIRNVRAANGADVVYEGTVTLVSGYTGGLLLRASADGTLGYEIGLSTVDNQFKLGVLFPNYASLATSPVNVQYGRPYRIKAVANGSLIEVYLDGAKLLTATDTRYSSGQFGVVVRGGWYAYQGVAHFDDLVAWELP